MEKISTSDVKVEFRVRRDFGNIEELAKSIKDRGLLYPIIVERNSLRLLDGERRLRACRDILKWDDVPVIYFDQLDVVEQRLIEIESNIKRKQFTWQEEALATQEIHRLLQAKEGTAKSGPGNDGWGMRQTAELLNISPATVVINCQLAEAMKDPNKSAVLNKELKKVNAYKKLKRLEEQNTLAALDKNIQTKTELMLGDCLEVMKLMANDCIDLIITDPPFGMHKKGDLLRDMDDEPEEIFVLLSNAAKEWYRILKPSGVGVVFFHIVNYSRMCSILKSAGLSICAIPLIWVKNVGAEVLPIMHSYEAALLFGKGKIQTVKGLKDVLTFNCVPSNERVHPVQKPLTLALHLIEALSVPGAIVLDPFCGAGTFPLAATLLGRIGKGIEKDKKYYDVAQEYCRTVEGGMQK